MHETMVPSGQINHRLFIQLASVPHMPVLTHRLKLTETHMPEGKNYAMGKSPAALRASGVLCCARSAAS